MPDTKTETRRAPKSTPPNVAPPNVAPTKTASPTIDSVLLDLPDIKVQGYHQRSIQVQLSHKQAALAGRLFESLRRQGLELRGRDQVYPWLLDQIAAALV